MLRTTLIAVTPFQQNARILAADGERGCVVVDPGGDVPLILKELDRAGLECREIWLTHSHLDHCGGVRALQAATGARLLGHPAERPLREQVSAIAALYGIGGGGMEDCPEPDRYLSGGEVVALGPLNFKVLFTPGHSPGHLCFYEPESHVLIAGDTVFAGSIGRTDLPGGELATLLASIRAEILTLPPETIIMSGHGDDTTVGQELRTNPFLQGEAYG